ncbi:MAG: stage III sporulation protein AB [Lachnospira sp.]
MKILGIVLIIAGTTSYGIRLVFMNNSHIQLLRTFKTSLELLSGYIQQEYSSIPYAFSSISASIYNKTVASFYSDMYKELSKNEGYSFADAWEKNVQKHFTDNIVKNADIQIIMGFAGLPIYLESNSQVLFISERTKLLDERINELSAQSREKNKMYKYLGFGLGVFLVLILI